MHTAGADKNIVLVSPYMITWNRFVSAISQIWQELGTQAVKPSVVV